jgi:hypothetical protein
MTKEKIQSMTSQDLNLAFEVQDKINQDSEGLQVDRCGMMHAKGLRLGLTENVGDDTLKAKWSISESAKGSGIDASAMTTSQGQSNEGRSVLVAGFP